MKSYLKTIGYFRSSALAISILLFINACGTKNTAETTSVSEAIPVKLMELESQQTSMTVDATGSFSTDDETFLSFKTGGITGEIFVRAGDPVRKGQLLATLVVTEVAAQVNQAKLGLAKATRDYERVKNLYADSVATLEQLQNATTAKELAQQQLEAASFNLEHSEIRAKNDGVVLRKMVNSGQVVAPGTPILQTSSKGKADWILKVAVSDYQWAAINPKDEATISTDAFPDSIIRGIVLSKSEQIDPATGSFIIDIQLVNGRSLPIASGMFGKARIQTSGKSNVWNIPYESLLDGNGSSGYVFVTNDQKVASRVPVTISAIRENEVVVSKGLEGYKYLIISGSAYLTDKASIISSSK